MQNNDSNKLIQNDNKDSENMDTDQNPDQNPEQKTGNQVNLFSQYEIVF